MIGAVGSVGRLGLVARRGRLLLYPGYVQDYLDRVTAADVSAGNTQGLELAVTDAFNTCLQAMVGDGSLGVSGGVLSQAASLIKASCLMMGARTLPGALVPLAADMPAPTNVNFVAGDYDRKNGPGDTNNATKYLDANRDNAADLQDNVHMSAYMATFPVAHAGNLFGRGGSTGAAGSTHANTVTNGYVSRCRSSGFSAAAGGVPSPCLVGVARNNSASYTFRRAQVSATISIASQTPLAGSVQIFGNDNIASFRGRICFYSIGGFLDIAILESRIVTLRNAIAAAIP